MGTAAWLAIVAASIVLVSLLVRQLRRRSTRMGLKLYLGRSTLSHLFPLPGNFTESGKPFDELFAIYRKWELLSLPVLFLACLPPLALAWWWLLEQLSNGMANLVPNAVFQARLSGLAWAVPALPLGIFTSSLPLDGFYRWRLKDRYPEYVRYCKFRAGYDLERAAKPMLAFFLVSAVVLLAPLFHWRAVFTNDEVVVYPFLQIGPVRHGYDEIAAITTSSKAQAPNGQIVDNVDRDHLIQFTDGYVWSTYLIWGSMSDEEKQQIIEFVSAKSGKEIRIVPFLEGVF